MYKLNKKFFISLLCLGAIVLAPQAYAGKYNIGKTATPEEIAGWDIDVRPDGKGLPKGKGSAIEGEAMYEEKCASCHGSFGEGEGRWPILAGGEGSLTHDRPEKSVGSYWPYASTLWDYINRAMPFPAPQSLTPDEVYAISAYVLYLNEIIEDDFVLTQDNLAAIKMPNEANFFVDDRPDTNNKRCMKDCKDPFNIEVVESLRGITPDQEDTVSFDGSEGSTMSEEAIAGKQTYDTSCLVCHGSGVAGAPKIGDESWEKRLEKGIPAVIKNAVNGFIGSAGVMPPKGGNLNLTDEQVANAVHYMLEAEE